MYIYTSDININKVANDTGAIFASILLPSFSPAAREMQERLTAQASILL
jgi:hypothetical protein